MRAAQLRNMQMLSAGTLLTLSATSSRTARAPLPSVMRESFDQAWKREATRVGDSAFGRDMPAKADAPSSVRQETEHDERGGNRGISASAVASESAKVTAPIAAQIRPTLSRPSLETKAAPKPEQRDESAIRDESGAVTEWCERRVVEDARAEVPIQKAAVEPNASRDGGKSRVKDAKSRVTLVRSQSAASRTSAGAVIPFAQPTVAAKSDKGEAAAPGPATPAKCTTLVPDRTRNISSADKAVALVGTSYGTSKNVLLNIAEQSDQSGRGQAGKPSGAGCAAVREQAAAHASTKMNAAVKTETTEKASALGGHAGAPIGAAMHGPVGAAEGGITASSGMGQALGSRIAMGFPVRGALVATRVDAARVLDGAAGSAPRVLIAGPARLDVGVLDGTHGWLRVRAELRAGGGVHTALMAGVAAHEALRAVLPEMAGYLKAEAVSVSRITLERAGAGWDAMGKEGGQRQDGSEQRGPAGGQTPQSAGQARKNAPELGGWTDSNSDTAFTARVTDSRNANVASRGGWNLSAWYAMPAAQPGAWLNVCA